MKIKKIFLKLLLSLIILIFLISFISAITNYSSGWFIIDDLIGGLVSGIVGAIINFIKAILIAPFNALRAINSLVVGGGTSGITPFQIFFNKCKLLDANIFAARSSTSGIITNSSIDSIIDNIKSNVAIWYYAIRGIAIGVVSIMLILNLVRSISKTATAEQKVAAKNAVVDWVLSFALIMFMHIIIIAILNLNDIVLNTIEVFAGGMVNINTLLDSLEAKVFDQDLVFSMACLIVYALMNIQTFKYVLIYIQRLLTIVLLIMISPIIPITYSANKMKGGNGLALSGWLKELFYNVFVQSLHAIVYAALVSVAMSSINTTVGDISQLSGALIAVTAMLFVKHAEKMVKTIFGFDNSQVINKNVVSDSVTNFGQTLSKVGHTGREAAERVAKGGPLVSFGKNADGSDIKFGQVLQGLGSNAGNAIRNTPNVLRNTRDAFLGGLHGQEEQRPVLAEYIEEDNSGEIVQEEQNTRIEDTINQVSNNDNIENEQNTENNQNIENNENTENNQNIKNNVNAENNKNIENNEDTENNHNIENVEDTEDIVIAEDNSEDTEKLFNETKGISDLLKNMNEKLQNREKELDKEVTGPVKDDFIKNMHTQLENGDEESIRWAMNDYRNNGLNAQADYMEALLEAIPIYKLKNQAQEALNGIENDNFREMIEKDVNDCLNNFKFDELNNLIENHRANGNENEALYAEAMLKLYQSDGVSLETKALLGRTENVDERDKLEEDVNNDLKNNNIDGLKMLMNGYIEKAMTTQNQSYENFAKYIQRRLDEHFEKNSNNYLEKMNESDRVEFKTDIDKFVSEGDMERLEDLYDTLSVYKNNPEIENIRNYIAEKMKQLENSQINTNVIKPSDSINITADTKWQMQPKIDGLQSDVLRNNLNTILDAKPDMFNGKIKYSEFNDFTVRRVIQEDFDGRKNKSPDEIDKESMEKFEEFQRAEKNNTYFDINNVNDTVRDMIIAYKEAQIIESIEGTIETTNTVNNDGKIIKMDTIKDNISEKTEAAVKEIQDSKKIIQLNPNIYGNNQGRKDA